MDYIGDTKGNARLPGIMTLGYIAAFDETLAIGIINALHHVVYMYVDPIDAGTIFRFISQWLPVLESYHGPAEIAGYG